MTRGLYLGASGMVSELQRHEIIANNLANVSTAGFKRDRYSVEGFSLALNRATSAKAASGAASFIGEAPWAYSTRRDFSYSPMKPTGNPLDAAIAGQGFFTVQTAQGTLYTRNGNFSRDKDGYLLTTAGDRVLSKTGAIKLPDGTVNIDRTGTISVDGAQVAQLRCVDFADPTRLPKVGNTYYRSSGQPAQELSVPDIKQGYLEVSNVNAVQEMVEMIATLRGFEANQRAVRSTDETLQKAVNELGRLG